MTNVWAVIAAVATGIVLISNAAEKIVATVKMARAPNLRQDERLTALERWKQGVDDKLNQDKKRLDGIEEDNRVTQQALLALLDHGIDGNNTEQMQHAKEKLQNHLINR